MNISAPLLGFENVIGVDPDGKVNVPDSVAELMTGEVSTEFIIALFLKSACVVPKTYSTVPKLAISNIGLVDNPASNLLPSNLNNAVVPLSIDASHIPLKLAAILLEEL
jgi:hypothetical protein